MADNNRRSWMIVPAHDPDALAQCQAAKPDVVVLDLEYGVPPKAKEAARYWKCNEKNYNGIHCRRV